MKDAMLDILDMLFSNLLWRSLWESKEIKSKQLCVWGAQSSVLIDQVMRKSRMNKNANEESAYREECVWSEHFNQSLKNEHLLSRYPHFSNKAYPQHILFDFHTNIESTDLHLFQPEWSNNCTEES